MWLTTELAGRLRCRISLIALRHGSSDSRGSEDRMDMRFMEIGSDLEPESRCKSFPPKMSMMPSSCF